MVTIKVVDKNSGKPAKDKKVTLVLDGLFTGGVTNGEWTDSEGEAHFDIDPRSGEVHIGGRAVHKGHLSGRVVVYI